MKKGIDGKKMQPKVRGSEEVKTNMTSKKRAETLC